MPRIQIATTCNNSCVFCAQAARSEGDDATQILQDPHGLDSSGARLNVGQLGRGEADVPVGPDGDALEDRLEAASQAAELVTLMGGEPTLVPDLVDYVRRAASGGAQVLLQTNARLLGCRVDSSGVIVTDGQRSLAEALKAAGLGAVEVALYGNSAALHDYHTRSPGSFRQTVLGLRASRAAGLRCALTTLATRSNYRHLPELVRLAHALGAAQLAIRSVLPEGRAAGSMNLEPSHVMLGPYLRAARQLASQLGLQLLVEPGQPSNFTDSSSEARSAVTSVQKLVSRREAAPRTGEWAAL